MSQEKLVVVSLPPGRLAELAAWRRASREKRMPGWNAMRAAVRDAKTLEERQAIHVAWRQKRAEMKKAKKDKS